MVVRVYSILDKVSGVYNGLFCAPADAALVRQILPSFETAKRSVSEFTLFQVGSYDVDNNSLSPCSPREVPWTSYTAPVVPKASKISQEEFSERASDLK